MSRKPQDNPEQSKRFIDMAREVEAAETKEEAERAFSAYAIERAADDLEWGYPQSPPSKFASRSNRRAPTISVDNFPGHFLARRSQENQSFPARLRSFCSSLSQHKKSIRA